MRAAEPKCPSDNEPLFARGLAGHGLCVEISRRLGVPGSKGYGLVNHAGKPSFQECCAILGGVSGTASEDRFCGLAEFEVRHGGPHGPAAAPAEPQALDDNVGSAPRPPSSKGNGFGASRHSLQLCRRRCDERRRRPGCRKGLSSAPRRRLAGPRAGAARWGRRVLHRRRGPARGVATVQRPQQGRSQLVSGPLARPRTCSCCSLRTGRRPRATS